MVFNVKEERPTAQGKMDRDSDRPRRYGYITITVREDVGKDIQERLKDYVKYLTRTNHILNPIFSVRLSNI